jgi:hypothetical protein
MLCYRKMSVKQPKFNELSVGYYHYKTPKIERNDGYPVMNFYSYSFESFNQSDKTNLAHHRKQPFNIDKVQEPVRQVKGSEVQPHGKDNHNTINNKVHRIVDRYDEPLKQPMHNFITY